MNRAGRLRWPAVALVVILGTGCGTTVYHPGSALLFAPYLDKNVQSYLESYVIDTRNGYLYGHVTSEQKQDAETLTIYSRAAERLVDRHWAEVLEDTGRVLARLVGASPASQPTRPR
jgi:hypothetical protein